MRKHLHLLMKVFRWYLSEGVPYIEDPGQLSWRVHMLPFIGEEVIYRKFHLDEPWDSPHNIQLLPQMPQLYGHPDDVEGTTSTRYLAVDGPNYLSTGSKLKSLTAVKDAEADTIAVCVVSADSAIPWTQPKELTVQKKGFKALMKQMPHPDLTVCTVEGAVLHMHRETSFDIFDAAASIAGGEPDASSRMTRERRRLLKR